MITDDALNDQIAYYRARAAEYDEWFLRQGRYDRGPAENSRWHTEVAEVRAALTSFAPQGHVLELAGGTGIWTEQLAQTAATLTLVDAAPEMLAINRARLMGAAAPPVLADKLQYVQADLFQWQPDRQYDVVFFSFWLSHVPPQRFHGFWDMVRQALVPGGRVFFIDSLRDERSTARDHVLPTEREMTTLTRRLNDGQEYRIVKVFHETADLGYDLTALGWQTDLHQTATFFLYGVCQ